MRFCGCLARAMFVCLALTRGSVATAAAADDEPARYKLAVGQQLTYAYETRSLYGATRGTGGERVTYWVAAARPGGGWHVIGEQVSWADPSDPKFEPIRDPNLIRFDLAPDGGMSHRAATSVVAWARHDPALDFPPLPRGAMAREWHAVERDGITARYSRGPATRPVVVEIVAARTGPTIDVFRGRRESRATFDLARGLVTRATDRDARSYATEHVRAAAGSLVADERIGAAELKRLADEAGGTLDAIGAADRLILDSPDGNAAAKLAEAGELLRHARAAVSLPAPAAILIDHVESLGRSADDWLRTAADVAALRDRPAPEWELTDLEGKRHALRDQRGKVVVLDFWFRRCDHCLIAMPAVRAVAEANRGRPVAVFGINVDRDPAGARAVADYFRLPYPTLLAPRDPADADGEPPAAVAYRVRGYPTLVVIGPDGAVRHAHFGDVEDLPARLGAEVDALVPSLPGPRR